eukprot:TRINITY_DN5297_c0_g1_i1.p1 TRINITY_DN5297_c0_g1~~TRINITY_DN5297_c0_g1_i1.p1  ORF type:complete len:460 (+),score=34.53 TRINITY_DN5297_c0_g1_i1:84-1382(+)
MAVTKSVGFCSSEEHLEPIGSGASEGHWTILLLSPRRPSTGNTSTIDRIETSLEQNNNRLKVIRADTNGPQCEADTEEIGCCIVERKRKELNHVVIEQRVDLIIGLHAIHAGRLLLGISCPYILIFGGTDINESWKLKKEMALMTEVVSKALQLVAFHQGMAMKCARLWPITANKIRVIAPAVRDLRDELRDYSFSIRRKLGIPDRLIQHSESATLMACPLFVLPCSIRVVKSPLFLVEAFARWHQVLKDNSSKITPYLLIIGPVLDSEYASIFFDKIERLPGVLYHKEISQRDLHSVLINEADVLVNSSVSEGLSNVILESMLLGLPVVARRNEGNESVIQDGHTGLLFDTPREFIRCAEKLIEEPISTTNWSTRTTNEIRAHPTCYTTKLWSDISQNAFEYVNNHHLLQTEAGAYSQLVTETCSKLWCLQ